MRSQRTVVCVFCSDDGLSQGHAGLYVFRDVPEKVWKPLLYFLVFFVHSVLEEKRADHDNAYGEYGQWKIENSQEVENVYRDSYHY
jgi:hypothetical protein